MMRGKFASLYLDSKHLFLTDAGLETDIIFNRGLDLPYFASIMLLRTENGREALWEYYDDFFKLAEEYRAGLIVESASWRASRDWAEPLGLSQEELDALNVASVQLLRSMVDEKGVTTAPILVSGCIGPRGDGYDPGRIMSLAEAEDYHGHQAAILASAKPDMLSALTMNNVNEAIGVTRAASATSLPFILSFTVETDGRLPTGDHLGRAIEAVDEATGAYPSYYMINCAHPTHFSATLKEAGRWTDRIHGIRANASRCSHAELDAMTELDIGDPEDLALRFASLLKCHPQIRVIGGCCGTDKRHIAAIAGECAVVNS